MKNDFQRDVRDGGLFMFLNHRLNRIKLLYWDTDGIAIWMKRLERGCFQRQFEAPMGSMSWSRPPSCSGSLRESNSAL
ncbi:IS66 family insertion sequence element accessory protein TnpB [Pirellulaceae bacterium SH467]